MSNWLSKSEYFISLMASPRLPHIPATLFPDDPPYRCKLHIKATDKISFEEILNKVKQHNFKDILDQLYEKGELKFFSEKIPIIQYNLVDIIPNKNSNIVLVLFKLN